MYENLMDRLRDTQRLFASDDAPHLKTLCGDAAKALAAYEETGLTPDEISLLRDAFDPSVVELAKALKEINDLTNIEHLRGLLAAEKDGRLVVLPKEAIAARYGVADMLDDFRKEAEFSDHSVGIRGITWAESNLLTAMIDGLNAGRNQAEAALQL